MGSDLLFGLTWIIDFSIMGTSLWLCLYLWPRGPRNRFLYSLAFLLLVLSTLYLGGVLSFEYKLDSIQAFVDFSAISILFIAKYLTHQMLPADEKRRGYWLMSAVTAAMFLGFTTILLFPTNRIVDDVFYISFNQAEFPVNFLQYFIIFGIGWNVYHLLRGKLTPISRVYLWALILGISSVIYGQIGVFMGTFVPRILSTGVLLVALGVLAFSIGRYQEFLEVRVSRYDVPVSIGATVVLILIYMLLSLEIGLSRPTIVVGGFLLIASLSLYGQLRESLQRAQTKEQQQHEAELRYIARNKVGPARMQHTMRRALAIICRLLDAPEGIVAISEDESFVVQASLHSLSVGANLEIDEPQETPARARRDLRRKLRWLVPGYAGSTPLVIVGLARRRGLRDYTLDNLDWVQDIADLLATLILTGSVTHSNETLLQTQKENTDALLSALANQPDKQVLELIEYGYRHINDYIKLGNSGLVELLQVSGVDHIERGKVVQAHLIEMVESLRPSGERPGGTLPKEWHSFVILHDAYIEEKEDRFIMSDLYISESTFYRYRRRAIRGIAAAILERAQASTAN